MRKLLLLGVSFTLAACSTLDSDSDFENVVDSITTRNNFSQLVSKPFTPSSHAIKGPDVVRSELVVVANYANNDKPVDKSYLYLQLSMFDSYDSYDYVTYQGHKKTLKVEQPTQKTCSDNCVITQYVSFPISNEDLNIEEDLEFDLSSKSSRLITQFTVPSQFLNAINQEGMAKTKPHQTQQTNVEEIKVLPLKLNGSKSQDMVQYWFGEATDAEQQQFADWAFSQRTSVTDMIKTESKPVEMMAYWYDKADKTEKSNILSWLLGQE